MEHPTKMPSWLVVMKAVHIDVDRGDEAKTGLFELLGDGLVQVVDLSEGKKSMLSLSLRMNIIEKTMSRITGTSTETCRRERDSI